MCVHACVHVRVHVRTCVRTRIRTCVRACMYMYAMMVDDDEMNFEEVVRVHVLSPKIIHLAIPDKKQTNKNSHIHFNNHPENDKQLYPRETVERTERKQKSLHLFRFGRKKDGYD